MKRGVGVAVLAVLVAGCGPDQPAVTPPAGLLDGCLEEGVTSLPITIKAAGSTRFPDITGTLSENGTAQVDWKADPGASTSTNIDGATATGTLTPTASSTPGAQQRSLRAAGTYDVGVQTVRISVTGTVNGPPPPCTGNGNWTINSALRGTWSIP